MRASLITLVATGALFVSAACQQIAAKRSAPEASIRAETFVALNALRNEINENYGFERGWPRVNRGPCGRFAKIFREEWNARFSDQINIAFVMMPEASDGVGCDHVLVRLPDGSYFDGGSGVVPGAALLKEFGAGRHIEEMTQFDPQLLDRRSYGLNREYDLCPNYSDELTRKIVRKHLDLLSKELEREPTQAKEARRCSSIIRRVKTRDTQSNAWGTGQRRPLKAQSALVNQFAGQPLQLRASGL
jgi:hypothetical protein